MRPTPRSTVLSRRLLRLIVLSVALLAVALYGGTRRSASTAASLANDHPMPAAQAAPLAAASAGSALHFDGLDDQVRVADVGNFDFATSLTVEAWVKPDVVTLPGAFRGLVSGRFYDSPSGPGGWVLSADNVDGSQWALSICTPTCEAATAPSGSLVEGQWSHVAGTYDGATITVYQDGVPVDSVSHSGDVEDVAYVFLGAWDRTFRGTLDEVRIWAIARSAAEIQSTMAESLTGNEPGLVAYWRLDEGTGQVAVDSTGLGQDGRLGALTSADAYDPAWVASDAPLGVTVDPVFELVPSFGGLGTEIGARSALGGAPVCGWVPGEIIELWWDDPEVKVGSFVVDAGGCFEGLFLLDDTEAFGASPDGRHVVSAVGSVTGPLLDVAVFMQTRQKLHLTPTGGPGGTTVALSGCDWGTTLQVDLLWSDAYTLVGQVPVDGSGCITGTLTIPAGKDGLYPLYAFASDNIDVNTGAVFWLQAATVILTPPEAPAGARVPLAGANWDPNEIVDFTWETTGEALESWPTDGAGTIIPSLSLDPFLQIPLTATPGEHTIRARGGTSKQTVLTPFTVVSRTLVFSPTTGYAGDVVLASGCGWVGNSQVTLEWGYLDPNGLRILWDAPVDPLTGCFGDGGAFSITIPSNTITGDVTVTATGDTAGDASAVFRVLHGGQFSLSTYAGYAGDAVVVQFADALVGESITLRWTYGAIFYSVGVTTPTFTDTLIIPLDSAVGAQSVSAVGSKGFYDETTFTVLDGSQITVTTPPPLYPGNTITVEGTGWAPGETVTFRLSADGTIWTTVGTVVVAPGTTAFQTDLALPDVLAGGTYTLRASGSKGRVAEDSLVISSLSFTLVADYATQLPALDGRLSTGEWPYAGAARFANGTIAVRSDETRLYVLLNVLGDTGQDPLGIDTFWLTFDIWEDGQIDAGWDLNFRLDPSGDLILEEYTGPGTFAPRNSTYLRSAYGAGFGCFYADGSARLGMNGLRPVFTCDQHRVWEIGIDLQTLLAGPGETLRMGVRLGSGSPSFVEDVPAGFTSNFAGLGAITLAPSQLASPPAGTLSGIGVGDYAIEVTQAVQDAGNSVPLVAGKATAVRVYPAVQADSALRVFLFGQRDGADLPGSPLVTTAVITSMPDLDLLESTANFLLPASWTTPGVTALTTIAERLDGSQPTGTMQSVVFHEQRVPNYWIVPVNIGTSTSPILPTASQIALQQSYLEATFPLHDVAWTMRPWQDLGANISTDLEVVNSSLVRLYFDTALAYILSGRDLSGMPEQIYGMLDNSAGAGGLANAAWANSIGVAASGDATGTSREGVMAHEINHNLDRKQSPTWGLHVTDGDDATSNAVWGCNAKGGDPAWQALNGADDEIGDRGFDTRLPWSLGTGTVRTVIPSNYPDLMSYCQSDNEANGVSGQLPTKWISAYRWKALFGEFVPRPALAAASVQAVSDVYYITGELHVDGTGSLDPVRALPGVPTASIIPGDYTLEVRDGGGAALASVPFLASFIDSEGEPVNTVYFSFQLPVQVGAAQIVLLHGADVLDTIVASANPPAVSITSPAGGESWSGEALIAWEATDLDGDPLTFSLFYSPDGGVTWHPVASRLTGTSTTVDVGRLPGGGGGKIRIVATDGFHTVQAESAGAFTVPDPGVLVTLQSPGEGQRFVPGEWIDLAGFASEVGGTPFPEEGLVWSVDGEPVEAGAAASIFLAQGGHTVTLTAYGAEGARGSASVTISVEAQAEAQQIFLPLITRN